MRLEIASVVPLVIELVEPPPVAAVPLTVSAPPVGAVPSDWAPKTVPAPVRPAPFLAVTVAAPVGEAAKV